MNLGSVSLRFMSFDFDEKNRMGLVDNRDEYRYFFLLDQSGKIFTHKQLPEEIKSVENICYVGNNLWALIERTVGNGDSDLWLIASDGFAAFWYRNR